MRPLLIAALLLAGTAAPVLAQDVALPKRVDRLEKEMRAVQRKVFPDGSQQFLEPQIGAPAASPPPGGTPATSAVADLTARVGSLEQELAGMTGQIEQNGFKIRQLEEQLARFRANSDSRLNALEGGAAPAAGRISPAPAAGAPAAPLDTPPVATAEPVASSGDAGEDAYLAAYRLWEQKQYAEAETALRAVVAKYPKHRRASYAQNLLGRAYLDDAQPAKAAEAFYANYQKMPRGERAPDSLYYLGQALMSLKPPKAADACKVYAELIDVYGEKIAQPLRDRVAKGRADAKCAA